MKKPFFSCQYSLRRLWGELLVFLLVSMTAVVLFFNYQQRRDLIDRTAQTQFDVLKQFSSQLDNGLTQAENYLYASFYNNENIYTMSASTDQLAQYHAKQALADLLSRGVQLNEFVEAAWFYQAPGVNGSREETFLARNNYTGITIREIRKMKELISMDLKDPASGILLASPQWNIVWLEDTAYLLWTTPIDNAFCGAWVSLPYLYTLFQERTLTMDKETDLICTLDGTSLLNTAYEKNSVLPADLSSWIESNQKNINIGMQSNKADFVLQRIIPCQNILQTSKGTRPFTLVLLLFFFIILISVIFYQFLIYRPFQQLLLNMDTIRFRRTDKSNNRLPVRGHFKDVQILSASINQLLDKNEELNQKIFDTELRERDVQVQYLQIRLKAHFYMNGLSLIHAMARMGQNDLIQELSKCLIEYLRFIDVDTLKFVHLREELDHVRSYARIQELRFPDLFEYAEDVSAELYDASIPPLVLQTFVENSIEHGMRQGENYRILIQAFYQEKDGLPGMHFSIEDNGTGFSEEQLREFSMKHYAIILNQNHGIGIKNVINRLRLLYDGKAEIHFDNIPEGGAIISLWLPLLDLEEDETDEI